MAHLIAFVRRTADEARADLTGLVVTLLRAPAEDWKAAWGWLLFGAVVITLWAVWS